MKNLIVQKSSINFDLIKTNFKILFQNVHAVKQSSDHSWDPKPVAVWPLLTGGRCLKVALCYITDIRTTKCLLLLEAGRYSLVQVGLYIDKYSY